MARIKLNMPEQFLFKADVDVRISDINYGGHLGNDSLLSILHEARMQFLKDYGFSEQDCGGVGLIMRDIVVEFKSEVFYGDVLEIFVAVGEFHSFGCDIFYKVVSKQTGKELVRVKTGIVFFDYEAKKLMKMTEKFKSAMTGSDKQIGDGI